MQIKTPGRICLYGEHQDYIGNPVISAAINLYIILDAKTIEDQRVVLHLPDIKEELEFALDLPLEYTRERDYFRSCLNVMHKHGFTYSKGIDCTITSTLPINAGLSSSSALCVSWINVLARLSDQQSKLDERTIAHYAYLAEVEEFGEPGGNQDHFATALGHTIYLEADPHFLEHSKPSLGTFVIGDSLEPKDTIGSLLAIKNMHLSIKEVLSKHFSEYSLVSTRKKDLESYYPYLSDEQREFLEAMVENHRITRRAREILAQDQLDHHVIGDLFNELHAILRDKLHKSTTKIERMIQEALNAGALGAKITGSGGGGCMIAYAPENPEDVADAISRAGGRSYIVKISDGTTVT
ncbi:MAG: GHMP kinase [Candidatus Heimdallarchaeota archaeon]|nr:GHMP kinase [Candidatus Heimdallarchaeota archaeon]